MNKPRKTYVIYDTSNNLIVSLAYDLSKRRATEEMNKDFFDSTVRVYHKLSAAQHDLPYIKEICQKKFNKDPDCIQIKECEITILNNENI